MGALFTYFTLAGPVVGGLGYYFDLPVVFWIGFALAGLNLFMNVASEAMNFPSLPLIFCAVGGVLLAPWYVGAAEGLLIWTAVEGLGELWARR